MTSAYRTISRPLIDALRQAALPVTVDLVRPGTWEALRTHLRAATDGSGWYHVVHFYLHGAPCDFAWLEEESRGRPVRLWRATRLEPFEGDQAFLFFETANDRQAEPISAKAAASLLGARIRAHVQLCWLALLLIRVIEIAVDDTWRNVRHELDRMALVTLATADALHTQEVLVKDDTITTVQCNGPLGNYLTQTLGNYVTVHTSRHVRAHAGQAAVSGAVLRAGFTGRLDHLSRRKHRLAQTGTVRRHHPSQITSPARRHARHPANPFRDG